MDLKGNFWDTHQELALVFDEEFVRSQDSSKIMHCIYMYVDPRSEIAMEGDDQKRLEYIKKYYPFVPEEYKDIIDTYIGFVPEIEISFNKLLVGFNKTAKLISEYNVIDIKTAKLQVDAGANVHKVIENLTKQKSAVMASRGSAGAGGGLGRAGYQPSRLEQGLVGGKK